MFQCFCIEICTAHHLNEFKTYCVGTHISLITYSPHPVHYRMSYSMCLFPVYVLCNYNINPTYNNKFNWYRKCIQTGIRRNGCANGSAVLEYAGCSNTTSIQYTQHAGRPRRHMPKFRNNLPVHNHFYASLSYFTAARDEIHRVPLHI
jgi:hypothetical protein